jgi:hypothetical protein
MAETDCLFASTVTFKRFPAPDGTSNRTDESDVHKLIKNEVEASERCGPNLAVTLERTVPKFLPTNVMETRPVVGPLPGAKECITCESYENASDKEELR